MTKTLAMAIEKEEKNKKIVFDYGPMPSDPLIVISQFTVN